ncbi:hypothetical protein OKW45_001954 [Paraburkholderia sp. WSM4175]|uniref:tail completion protein gp17 n=1 Tax=Paraburkholderia sp. WSM4175 TaxID=2991072 RepID=UPI003D21208A
MTEAALFSLIEKALPARAFFILAPMAVREPYLILTRVSLVPQNTLCGYAHIARVSYRLDSYALTRAEALDNLARAIASLRASGDPPTFENQQDMYEEGTRIHRVTVELITWFEPEVKP